MSSATVNHDLTPPAVLMTVQRRTMPIAGVAILLSMLGAVLWIEVFFRAFLVGFLFWIGITLGCMALLMLQHLTGGDWGFVMRRVMESAMNTMPLMAALFVVILAGMKLLYPWVSTLANDPIVQAKSAYLNVPFFIIRAVIYFGVWLLIAALLSRWSRRQDETFDPREQVKMQNLSGAGVLIYGLTWTFASVDWAMSTDPHWFSTIYGIMLLGGHAVSAMGFMIAMAVLLLPYPPFAELFKPKHLHDLGKLLLAFIMLWAYFNFSQLLIVWSGNLPEEIPWYIARFHGWWAYVSVALLLFHFMFPFVLLLSRDIKRHARTIGRIAAFILVVRLVDVIWLIVPGMHTKGHEPPPISAVLYVLVPLAIGGVWMTIFLRNLRRRPLLVPNDVRFAEVVLGKEEHAH
jgi:hypothetical protein